MDKRKASEYNFKNLKKKNSNCKTEESIRVKIPDSGKLNSWNFIVVMILIQNQHQIGTKYKIFKPTLYNK